MHALFTQYSISTYTALKRPAMGLFFKLVLLNGDHVEHYIWNNGTVNFARTAIRLSLCLLLVNVRSPPTPRHTMLMLLLPCTQPTSSIIRTELSSTLFRIKFSVCPPRCCKPVNEKSRTCPLKWPPLTRMSRVWGGECSKLSRKYLQRFDRFWPIAHTHVSTPTHAKPPASGSSPLFCGSLLGLFFFLGTSSMGISPPIQLKSSPVSKPVKIRKLWRGATFSMATMSADRGRAKKPPRHTSMFNETAGSFIRVNSVLGHTTDKNTHPANRLYRIDCLVHN